jgi:hypothetical protein
MVDRVWARRHSPGDRQPRLPGLGKSLESLASFLTWKSLASIPVGWSDVGLGEAVLAMLGPCPLQGTEGRMLACGELLIKLNVIKCASASLWIPGDPFARFWVLARDKGR